MKFLNKGKDIKIRVDDAKVKGEAQTYTWLTVKTGEVVDLPEVLGKSNNLEIVDETNEAPVEEEASAEESVEEPVEEEPIDPKEEAKAKAKAEKEAKAKAKAEEKAKAKAEAESR